MTANPEPDAQAGTVAAVLAVHPEPKMYARASGFYEWTCLCGFEFQGRVGAGSHNAHVAAALAAAGLTTETDRTRDELRAADSHRAEARRLLGLAESCDWTKGLDVPYLIPSLLAALAHALLADQPPTPDEGGARE